MLILQFCNEGKPISDFEAEDTVKKLYNLEECSVGTVRIKVSTANIIDVARALVAEKVMVHTKIAFSFQNEILPLDKEGNLTHWPYGFCDHTEGWLTRIFSSKRKNSINEH